MSGIKVQVVRKNNAEIIEESSNNHDGQVRNKLGSEKSVIPSKFMNRPRSKRIVISEKTEA
jgi:hypothetical protein